MWVFQFARVTRPVTVIVPPFLAGSGAALTVTRVARLTCSGSFWSSTSSAPLGRYTWAAVFQAPASSFPKS